MARGALGQRLSAVQHTAQGIRILRLCIRMLLLSIGECSTDVLDADTITAWVDIICRILISDAVHDLHLRWLGRSDLLL